MSDKTVPHNADEYKRDDDDKHVDTSHVDGDPLVERAESDEGETPNRDESEFSNRHLKDPEYDLEHEKFVNENADESE